MPPPERRARRRLLLVDSHPDDETIITGGTIARYAAEPDTDVTVVTCTLGEEGEVMVPELAAPGPSRRHLARRGLIMG